VQPTLSGICGSDLATVDGRSSTYFEDLVSFPFVPGHEVVGTLVDEGHDAAGHQLAAGQRVVIEPVLGCAARGIEPPCPACAKGRTGDCERVAHGHLRPGLQTGFCADTGGGWSAAGLVAHHSQIHPVPEDLDDRDAVLVEPLACAVHAALAAGIEAGDTVAVLGAGTVGLAVTAALAQLATAGHLAAPGTLVVGARHAHQRQLAVELGAGEAVEADQLGRVVRRRARTLAVGRPSLHDGRLAGGADVVIDCVGSATSLAQALGLVRPRGRVVMVGMPGRLHVDLAPLWHREVTLAGAYAYGTERLATAGGEVRRRSFDMAFEVARATGIGRLVSATYPIERFEEALAHAGSAGRRGAVKVAFDLTARAPRAEPRSRPGDRRRPSDRPDDRRATRRRPAHPKGRRP
jgi:threonine dehydrogenase-like Zn-dependent dehydrogenase